MQMVDYFASIVWLIMRGDAVATEFLAALTDSQVSELHALYTNLRASYCPMHPCAVQLLLFSGFSVV